MNQNNNQDGFKVNVEQGYFTEEEVKRKKGIVFDVEDDSKPNLPSLENLDTIYEKIIEIQKYMLTDEMIDLEETDRAEFEDQMEKKFPKFSMRYYAVFQKVISGEDLTYLFKMLESIRMVQTGRASLEDVEKKLGEDLAAEYIHPKTEGENKTNNNNDNYNDDEDKSMGKKDGIIVNANNVRKKKRKKRRKKKK